MKIIIILVTFFIFQITTIANNVEINAFFVKLNQSNQYNGYVIIEFVHLTSELKASEIDDNFQVVLKEIPFNKNIGKIKIGKHNFNFNRIVCMIVGDYFYQNFSVNNKDYVISGNLLNDNSRIELLNLKFQTFLYKNQKKELSDNINITKLEETLGYTRLTQLIKTSGKNIN